jgi:hypothetical protein
MKSMMAKIGTPGMRSLCSLIVVLGLCAASYAQPIGENLVFQRYPQRENLGVLCWSVFIGNGMGFLSQITVLQTDKRGEASVLWQSSLEPAYSPQIKFMPEITMEGLPLALVERQTGAGSWQLDVIGKAAGHIKPLLQLDGFQFDVEKLNGAELPVIIAHEDASILDVPEIYRWNGSGFVETSAAHPEYYRRVLAEDKAKLPPDMSGVVAVNLSRIAVLSGNPTEAKAILDAALLREQAKEDEADREAMKSITEALEHLLGR